MAPIGGEAVNAPARAACVFVLLLPRPLAAQGPTSAAIDGRITDSSGAWVNGAIVRVVNLSTGQSWTATTPATGRFIFEHIAVGGPYRIEARALGFSPEVRTGVVLALGERLAVDMRLEQGAVSLAGVVVSSTAPALGVRRLG
ncbi:MAG TPA: carboxypeptidase-like regulatory domain-containing protein, partial [Gemmatimonadaceae bacterium]|nr:carboxypeptidase-like regulatory domain-containing protein [Gemmatimonadaceae bacterium]